tara:strand:- start:1533 stop:2303 length:771 start_codon:yes stop_codon:yes gene_type:complete
MYHKIAHFLLLFFVGVILGACTTAKDIYYFQDAETYGNKMINYENSNIQPNDILNIKIGASIAESALPYNKRTGENNNLTSLELLKINGYLVSLEGTIKLPILGVIKVTNKTTSELELNLVKALKEGEHLIKPFVSIRLVNAKVTILGEVNSPGTYTFTEQFISIPQALGYAGDLTINGKRTNLLLIREVAGSRTMTYIDLTTTNWMNDASYRVKPNDVIVVNPNTAGVKSSGFLNSGNLISIIGFLLTASIYLTR